MDRIADAFWRIHIDSALLGAAKDPALSGVFIPRFCVRNVRPAA
jgi:hypothetical protein